MISDHSTLRQHGFDLAEAVILDNLETGDAAITDELESGDAAIVEYKDREE
jgi:hypothetical protein